MLKKRQKPNRKGKTKSKKLSWAKKIYGLDSSEEVHFYWMLLELQKKGYIKEIIMRPEQFVVIDAVSRTIESIKKYKTKEDKVISKESTVLNDFKYTPDFKIL